MIKEKNIWDKVARSFHVTSMNSRAHRDKYLDIAKIVVSKKPDNILDLGCGSGILEKRISEIGYSGSILGVDYSGAMVEIAKGLKIDGDIRFEKHDLNDYFPSGPFDLIVSINALFFINDKLKFFKNISKQLSFPNATFILFMPIPEGGGSIMRYVGEHFKSTNFLEKILIVVNELGNIPHYTRMVINELKLRRLEAEGRITFSTVAEVEELALASSLVIVKRLIVEDKRGIMFEMRRGH